MIYVFGRKPIDVLDCVTGLVNSINDSPRACSVECVVLRCDVVYSYKAAEIADRLHAALDRPIYYRDVPLKAEPQGQPVRSVGESERSRATDQAAEDVVLYIGPESLSLTNLLVTHGSSEVLDLQLFLPTWETELLPQRSMLTTRSHAKQG